MMEEAKMAELKDYPAYESNKPPQWYRYHKEVSYLDELEKVWGKRWGAQGIGKLEPLRSKIGCIVSSPALYSPNIIFYVYWPFLIEFRAICRECQ